MKTSILFVLIIFPYSCFSQINVSFSTGLAAFNMQEMKKHQAEIHAQFPIDVKIMKSFPAFWFYELSVTGKVANRVNVGAMIGFTSTGGRMNYQDYSGEIECNQFTTAWTIAGQGEVLLNPKGKWPIYFTGKAGAIIGRYDLDVYSQINTTSSSDSFEFNSLNLFIEPGLMLSKRIVGILSARLNAGYNLNVYKGNQKLADNPDLFLQDDSGNEVTLDWSGFRVGVGLSVVF